MLSYQQAACEISRHICEHSAHGYSQQNRVGIGTGGTVGETVTLSDGTQVGISTGDRDCSSMSIESYAAMGVNVGSATYTGNMRSRMVASGNFKWHNRADLGALEPGDLLLKESSHTAVYLGNGEIANASASEHGTTSGALGDQTGREIMVRNYYDPGWDGFLRYVGPARAGADTIANADFEVDEMDVLISIPQSDDMACPITVWVHGDQVHDLADPENVRYLQKVYAACHDGAEMPTIELSGSRECPEFQRFLQACLGGIPDPSIFPAVDLLEARSSNRSDSNNVVD